MSIRSVRADRPEHQNARVDSDADFRGRLAPPGTLTVECPQLPEHIQCGIDGVFRPLGEERQHGVAYELVDHAAMPSNGRPDRAQILIDEVERLLRRHLLGEAREAAYVGEQHGHDTLHLIAEHDVGDALLSELLQELPRHKPCIAVADLRKLQMDVDPGKKLVAGERLGQVVVGAGAEPVDQVRDAILGGEQDDRQFRRRKPLPYLLADLEPRDPRHHDVEQDQVAGVVGSEVAQGLLPVGGGRHLVLRQGEVVDERLHVHRLVVHHEDPMAGSAERDAGLA